MPSFERGQGTLLCYYVLLMAHAGVQADFLLLYFMHFAPTRTLIFCVFTFKMTIQIPTPKIGVHFYF
jgi:heme/copper-type cytochrome/quinol oxidase subunit 4